MGVAVVRKVIHISQQIMTPLQKIAVYLCIFSSLQKISKNIEISLLIRCEFHISETEYLN